MYLISCQVCGCTGERWLVLSVSFHRTPPRKRVYDTTVLGNRRCFCARAWHAMPLQTRFAGVFLKVSCREARERGKSIQVYRRGMCVKNKIPTLVKALPLVIRKRVYDTTVLGNRRCFCARAWHAMPLQTRFAGVFLKCRVANPHGEGFKS